jgi:hypothetical protein
MLEYNFFIKVLEDGQKIPSINAPFGKYEFLYDLANDSLITSEGVAKELIEARKVIGDEI